MVYCLMMQPRSKTAVFSDTAMSYLYELAADRNLDQSILDDSDAMAEYFGQGYENEWMRRGVELEALARTAYTMGLPIGCDVEERGFVPDSEYGDFYGDSPDGIVTREDSVIGCIEIKCPKSSTWIRYCEAFRRGSTLKEVESKYYWQCQSHMRCNHVEWCDFIYYDPYMRDGLQVERVMRNEEDIQLMVQRIVQANEIIKTLHL